MKTKNNWITSNLKDRLVDLGSPFSVRLNPYAFKAMDFKSAVDMTIKEVSDTYLNLHLALSGGYDSEFILRAFHRLKINIIPVIVCYGNENENVYAHKVCNELGISPVKINVSDKEYLNCFTERVYKKFNGTGIFATQVLFAADYVQQNNGTLITGNHLIGDDDEMISNKNFASSNEWDFYIDYTHPSITNIDLFLYTLELAHSMLPNSKFDGTNWQEYKHNLYGIEYRNKIRPKYPREMISKLKELDTSRSVPNSKYTHQWSREELNDILKGKNLNV